jgi:hypothetical protein
MNTGKNRYRTLSAEDKEQRAKCQEHSQAVTDTPPKQAKVTKLAKWTPSAALWRSEPPQPPCDHPSAADRCVDFGGAEAGAA